jgi:hypothetical protein
MLRHVLILLAAIALAYANSFQGEFLFDSYALVVQDARVHQLSAENVHGILTENYWGKRNETSGLYRPVTTFSYLLNYQWAGPSAWAFHLVNLQLHLIVALLAYAVVRRVSGSAAVAFWAVLIWGVHPVNTEAVTNIAGRPELLAAACVLGGFLVYQRVSAGSSRWKNQTSDSPTSNSACNVSRTVITVGQTRQSQQRHIRLIVLGTLFLVALLGVFSKESAAVLLGLVLLYDWHQRRRPDVNGCLAIALAIVLRALVPWAGVMSHAFVDNPEFAAGFWVSRMTAADVMGRLVGLWCWPATLSADYSFGQILLTHSWIPLGMLAVFVGLAVWKRWFWALCFLVAILPASNLVIRMGSVMAERFLYLPGLGLAVLVVIGITRWPRMPRWAAVGAMVVLAVALAGRTHLRNRDWTGTPLHFWEQTARTSPKSFKPKTQLAAMYFAEGRTAEAIQQADQAVKILGPVPDRWNAYEPYAEFWNYYQAQGDSERVKEMARKVAAIFNAQPTKKTR